ncbi:hypothetical protein ACWDSJ_12525 [Nocardia sp. NPDC003482]
MTTKIRTGTLILAALAIGYYLWHGITYHDPNGFGDEWGWVGWQMGLPIIALTVVPIVFAFTGAGIFEAFTGRNSSAFRDGAIGIGTVRAVRQTGLTVNDQPQVRLDLDVEGEDGQTFASHAKVIVPLTELALLRPGVVLPVRYLPGRTDRVELDRSGDSARTQAAYNEAMIRRGVTTRDKLDIAERGVAAQAVVRSLSAPGEIRDGHVKVLLELGVTRPDGGVFTARTDKFVPPAAVPALQVGRIVQVRYLPGREDEVVIAIPVNS